ncbi:MAG: lysine--tRNA ligase [Candidatus Woesearchaeota archaeon]|nr:lysine--tRNA ligase [Candidatus Woesearchaeota archaeon]
MENKKEEKSIKTSVHNQTENEEAEEDSIFWADKLAEKIIARRKFFYSDREFPKRSEFVVKTSASISGVLHIGRLSDTIRGDSVYRALKDSKVKARFIWVAEDMDPLRKVPKGVPEDYVKYIGMPITSVPDPDGCHKSYAEHHKSEYMKVIKQFVHEDMEIYSMQEEYDRGSFKPYIKKAMENIDRIKEIAGKYRTTPLQKGWSPWVPICQKCGKISTTKITEVKDGLVHYECSDYDFETQKAVGCGYKGVADPLKDKGKLMWKSEWAAQWARWNICTEGAGKEYQVPLSAFWTNGEITENVFDFPMPDPIFYEHLMIDGTKMSASLGNIVYPRDWLEVATPELLRYFYNKRLMKTRSFSWKDLPQMYDEFDQLERVHSGIEKPENEKDEKHLKRLYEISVKKEENPLSMSFSHASVLAQIFQEKEGIIASLRKTGQYRKEQEERIMQRIEKAKYWVTHYAPEESRFTVQERVNPEIKLSPEQKHSLKAVAKILSENHGSEKEFSEKMYNAVKATGLQTKEFFRAGYLVLLNRERGPRLAPFLLALGERAAKLFEEASNQSA